MNKEKTSFRFNAFDMIVIILILIVCVAAVSFLGGTNNQALADEHKTVYFTVEINDIVNEEYADKIEIGAAVKESTKGYYLGVVEKVDVRPTRRTATDFEKGAYKRVDVPDTYSVYVTLKCNGTETDSDISAEGQSIKVGKEMAIKGKGFAGLGYVTELRTE